MRAPAESTQQLDALLGDTEFHKLIEHVGAEVMRAWNVDRQTATGIVISAVGEPGTLASVYSAWFAAKARMMGTGLAKVIMRRRVLDLMRCDARRPLHDSLPGTADELDCALAVCDSPDGSHQDPRSQVELCELVARVRTALHSFAEQGMRQERQAQLVRHHAIDEVSHSDLARQLECSPTALRVRIHKAMRALRRHIETEYPELGDLLERRPGSR